MRRDPHGDPPARRRNETHRGPPATLGHIRSHGVRRLLIYCSTGLCHHTAVVDANRWPDDMAIRELRPKAVRTKCGMISADARPGVALRGRRHFEGRPTKPLGQFCNSLDKIRRASLGARSYDRPIKHGLPCAGMSHPTKGGDLEKRTEAKPGA
jgi:hypothetical protein